MKIKIVVLGVIAVVVIGGGIVLATKLGSSSSPNSSNSQQEENGSTAANGYQTAKAALQTAKTEALKKASDVFLTDLYSLTSQQNSTYADGTSKTWYLRFYSPSQDTVYKVTVEKGSVTTIKSDTSSKKTQIPDGWIDSPQAGSATQSYCSGMRKCSCISRGV